MKKFAAIITAVHTDKEVFTISAETNEEALRLADEMMYELVDEGTFDEDDAIDVDVVDLNEVAHVNAKHDPDNKGEAAFESALKMLIRISRDTDGELSDKALARILCDRMHAREKD